MDKRKRTRLRAAGWTVGTPREFLGLSDEEAAFVEFKLALSKTLQALRAALELSQVDVAKRLHSSQSRVAKIEAGSDGVSLDLSFRGFFAVGGKLSDLRRGMFAPPGGKKMTRFRTAHASGRRTSSPRRTPRTPPRS